jgi:hypothetical protein
MLKKFRQAETLKIHLILESYDIKKFVPSKIYSMHAMLILKVILICFSKLLFLEYVNNLESLFYSTVRTHGKLYRHSLSVST